MCTKFDLVDCARYLFDHLPNSSVMPSEFHVSSLITACDRTCCQSWEMRKEEISCTENTFATVITACSFLETNYWDLGLKDLGMYSEAGSSDDAEFVFKEMPERDLILEFHDDMLCLHGSLVVGYASITMYAKSGMMVEAKKVCQMMPSEIKLLDKNTISWNAIIAANAHHGLEEEVLKCIAKMRNAGIDLDQFSFSEGLAAVAKLAALEEGQQLHCLAVKLGFDWILLSRLSWNILISAFARHGYFQKARETFNEMLEMGVKPDHVTFVSLLSACSHEGLVDEGRLIEAKTFISEMPVPPDALVCRTLLASCKTHGNLELGRKAAEHLIKLDPSDDSAYVLYSNVCATTGKWGAVEDVRRQMGSYNIKKKPAFSWVKLKNEVVWFRMGDQTHPQTNEIYAKLGELKKLIKEAGYVPDTSYALQDTDEEQREHNLWNHSEKLALAFGLTNIPSGSTIKVFRNLRVCGDCHSVYKFVNGIKRRKIVLRDPNRFHHFSDGQCSCRDYW
ncbi:Detected protein of confused Function [Hibiscus syriacus]|uniref:Detected protein of confused Function n=1 Tax=Hibiscus syriacus TaxID=106335 RepID=A0A6A2XU98_HIBSY|nr:Detected protein of confused Function [Hibiscus syriacus]